MLKRLHLRNFTVFADAEFEFGAGLNVLVGTNGTGKTHVLKAGYVVLYGFLSVLQETQEDTTLQSPHEGTLDVHNKLKTIFRSSTSLPYEIIRNGAQVPEAFLDVETTYPNSHTNGPIIITSGYAHYPGITWPTEFDKSISFTNPVFIPAKEVLTLGWILPLYERREIPIDETYPDLLRLLSGPPLRQPEPAHIVEKLAQLIGGKVEEEGGHFYLAAPDQPRLEMNLVAEGMRKFATLYKLLANGTLTPQTTLFWDEPEANLNPALLKEMAVVLTDLAQAGFQIILATHSLFLMKELHILSRQRKKLVRYFGLYAGEKGDVQVEQQNDFMQLQHIAALDAELTQTFDFDEVLDQDYAGDS